MLNPAGTASGEPDTGQNSLRDIEGIIFSAQLDRGIAEQTSSTHGLLDHRSHDENVSLSQTCIRRRKKENSAEGHSSVAGLRAGFLFSELMFNF